MVAPNQPPKTSSPKSRVTQELSIPNFEYGAQVVKETSATGVISILAQKFLRTKSLQQATRFIATRLWRIVAPHLIHWN